VSFRYHIINFSKKKQYTIHIGILLFRTFKIWTSIFQEKDSVPHTWYFTLLRIQNLDLLIKIDGPNLLSLPLLPPSHDVRALLCEYSPPPQLSSSSPRCPAPALSLTLDPRPATTPVKIHLDDCHHRQTKDPPPPSRIVPQPSNLSSISPTTTTCYLAILELPLDLPHTHKTAFETNNHKSSPETEKGDEIERGKSDARETQNHTQFPFFSKFDDLLGSLGVGIVQHSKRRKVPGGRPAHR
jgi:hypothetical protein